MNPNAGRFWKGVHSLLNLPYLVVISSVVFLIIIGMAGMLIYQDAWVMRDLINDDFSEQQLILARQAASQIDAILHDIGIELNELKRFLSAAPEDARGEAMRAALQRTRAKGLIEIGLMDAQGRITEARSAQGVAPTTAQRVQTGCPSNGSDRMVLGPLRLEQKEPNVRMVTSVLCTRVRLGGKGEATLFARLDVSHLVGAVTRDIRSGKTGYAWAINEAGMFLHHPEQEFVGKNAFTARKERQPHTDFKQINRIMKHRMLQGQEGKGIYVSGWHRGTQGEIAKLIAFTPVKSEALAPGNTWSVAVVAPTGEVAEAVGRMYLRHYAAGGAIVLGMVVFGLLLAMNQYRTSQTLRRQVKEIEAHLQEAERIYRRVVEQATDLIYIFDLDMHVVLLNPQTADLFSHLVITERDGGTLPDDADLGRDDLYIGRALDELMRPRDAAFMKRQITRVLERQSSISYEHTVPIEGRKVRLSTKLVPIRDDRGEVRYLLGISRDITEQEEMGQRIYNTEKLASIGTLAAGVAHEINNPLAVILGFTDLLLEKFEPDSSVHEDLKVIETNANNAKKTVENLLTFARVTEGLEDSLSVEHSVETVVNVAKNTLMTKKIELVTALPDDLPRVRGDSREFQQVIFNLINNSVAAMDKTGGTLTLSAVAEDGWVHLTVADTGEGIPDRIKAQIFDPFFTTKKVGEGTGLGLSLCYGIVRKYGGKMSFSSVSLEDNPNGPTGTTFTVSMPADERVQTAEGVA